MTNSYKILDALDLLSMRALPKFEIPGCTAFWLTLCDLQHPDILVSWDLKSTHDKELLIAKARL
jgi:hypothetical protein